jgi:cytochrome c556
MAGCSPSTPPTTPPGPALWGDLKPLVSVRELMRYTIDPAADNVFLAVSTVVTKDGVVDTVPKNDADWEKIQIGAVTLAEGIYLLKVPRPFTPPGDENNSQGPNAVELSPAQITAKVEADPVEWNARIEAVRNAALEVLEIVKTRNVDELWAAGEDLDRTCEACHRSYWYPGENAAFYRQLRRKLQEFRQQTSTPAAAVQPKP